ncbi:MbnP family protein [Chitinophaga nivalis]|uniref:Copper-binding protein MbnP-like domain-containing protein n=1 Tax=Chitinophaga nivalis TaxID=2991709 RepID=A0ABT3ISB2_9BACT|nr:MbnP family protein [Chitinophaga nivalis]MCW3463716.1 hypothetical protein [Chitinophaga nivalis]MCW3486594.1 hypothetical protein [Chitinophaga nivalis]
MILRIFISYAGRLLVFSSLCVLLASCDKKETSTKLPVTKAVASLQLSITHLMNGQPLVRKTKTYTNPSGESFTITRFRYFLSNVAVITADDVVTPLPVSYFLVDDATDSTRTIRLDNVPEGSYKGIRFLIGVDSVRNFSGDQIGPLAPETGMFWTWNSGYIMAQLEGVAPVSPARNHEFLFHAGGFRSPYNVGKTITLSLPQTITVGQQRLPKIDIAADAARWFVPNTISFKTVSVVMAAGPDAMKLADNYRQMFTVKGVHN